MEGVRIWNFQGYWGNGNWNFGGLIKNNWEFPGVIKNKWNCLEFLRFLVLDLITQFCGVPRGRWSFVLPEISRSKVRKLKFPGFFSKKVFSQHPSVWNYKRKSCKISPLDKTIRRVVYFRHFYILWHVCYPNSNTFPPPSQECTFKWNMLFRGFFSLNWPKI